MDELRVYIANLGKYNEGELVGEWFTLPVDEEKVAEQIGLNEIYEEYAIHDYELPFEFDEYISLEELNRLATLAQELEGMPFEDSIQEIQQAFSLAPLVHAFYPSDLITTSEGPLLLL